MRLHVFGLLFLASCAPANSKPALERAHETVYRGETMGSTYTIKAVSSRDLRPAIEEILAKVDLQMSTYRADSELMKFNKNQSLEPQPVSAEIRELVALAAKISEATEGALDITLRPLFELWGFGPKDHDQPPALSEVMRVKALTGMTKFSVSDVAIQKKEPRLELDLSSMAAGYAVDLIDKRFRDLGVQDFMIEVTGEVMARGRKPDGTPWRIGIQLPKSGADPTAVLTQLPLNGRALATSGSYQRYFESGGTRYGHILDPKTGMPRQTSVLSVSVLHKSAAIADAYATAFFVLGPEKSLSIAAAQPELAVLFVEEKDGALETQKSANFPNPAQ